MKSLQNESQKLQGKDYTQTQFDLFSVTNTKCISKHQASYVCIDRNCSSQNPFVCCSQQCQCATIHLDCYQKSIKSLSKNMQSKKVQAIQTETKVNEVFDKINTKLSAEWDRILLWLKQKSENNQLKTSDNTSQESESKDKFEQNKLTGSLLNKMFNSEKIQHQQKQHEQSLKKIQQRGKEFQEKELKNFIQQVKILLGVEKKVFFDQKNLNKTLKRCSHLRLRCVTFQKEDNFSLGVLSPTINQLMKGKQKILKWSVKINFITHWIGMGICLRNFLEKKDFNFNHYQTADHGSYIISSNEYIWSYKNKEENFKREGAFKMRMGDVVNITFDVKRRELRFWNERLMKEIKMEVTYWPEEGKDEYVVALGMYQQGDEAEILEETIQVCGNEGDDEELLNSSFEIGM